VAVDSGKAFWCQARSNSPFLFSAWRLIVEQYQNPEGFIWKRWQTPVRTFVMLK
jgi:hypothetical protein